MSGLHNLSFQENLLWLLLHLYSISDAFSGTLGNSSVLYRQKRSLWTLNTLFTIDCQFPKLDVAGSIPVSRSNVFNGLRALRFSSVPFLFR